MLKAQSRRNFLRTAPLAAAVSLSLTDTLLHASALPAEGQGSPVVPKAPFQIFSAQDLQAASQGLQGNKILVEPKDRAFNILLTKETAKSAKEFEWHEGRDHILHVIEGSTEYEIGGTPKGGHSTGPGEWLAPTSEGCTKVTLNKGDMLVLPRNTPHRRSTTGSVTLTLVSPMGTMKA
jgi:quercetin dioxygenase-like cupin family protein